MKVKKNLTLKIVIALILGIAVGSIFNIFEGNSFVQNTNQYVFNVLGQIFLNLIFMLVVPVVFVSIVLGVVGVGDPKLLGGIGLKTVIFFLTTTAIAIIIAMALALVFKPGAGQGDLLNSDEVKKYGAEQKAKSGDAEAPENQTFDQTLINLFPKNPMQSMVEQDMLPIITFAIFIGIGMIALGNKIEVVRTFLEQTNDYECICSNRYIWPSCNGIHECRFWSYQATRYVLRHCIVGFIHPFLCCLWWSSQILSRKKSFMVL